MSPFYVTTYIKGHSIHKYKKNKNQPHEDRFFTDGWSHWGILERGTDFSKSWCQLIPPSNTENPAISKQETSPVTEKKRGFKPMLLSLSFDIGSEEA